MKKLSLMLLTALSLFAGAITSGELAKNAMAQARDHVTSGGEDVPWGTARDRRPPPKRARDLKEVAIQIALQHALEPSLVLAVIEIESNFDHMAVSRVGAMGLMQLMPATAARFGAENAFDPIQNMHAGCAYLAHLLAHYRGRLDYSLAAYNAGPGRVRASGGPPESTRVYIRRAMRARARWRERLGEQKLPESTLDYTTSPSLDEANR